MAHRVSVNGEYGDYYPTVRQAALRALTASGAREGEVTVLLADEDQIRRMNASFAGEDQPTDVLSFEDGTTDPDTNSIYLGDVVVAVPVARAQAERAGHALEEELRLLTIHGVLHLVGFDHGSEDARRRMWEVQDRVLAELGSPIRSPQDV